MSALNVVGWVWTSLFVLYRVVICKMFISVHEQDAHFTGLMRSLASVGLARSTGLSCGMYRRPLLQISGYSLTVSSRASGSGRPRKPTVAPTVVT